MTAAIDTRLDPTWSDRAACRGITDDTFFPIGTGKTATQQTRRALAICNTCPVTAACRADAIHTGETGGIRGALTPDQLEQAIRETRR